MIYALLGALVIVVSLVGAALSLFVHRAGAPSPGASTPGPRRPAS